MILLICCLSFLGLVSSIPLEDRLQLVENHLLSTKAELQQVKRDNMLLKADVYDLMKDRNFDREEIKKLNGQIANLMEHRNATNAILDELYQQIQVMESNCCGNGNTLTTDIATTTSSSITTTWPINQQNEYINNIGHTYARMAIFAQQKLVAVGTLSGVNIYDLESKQLVRNVGKSWCFNVKQFRQNLIIDGSLNGIRVWNVETGELVNTLNGRNDVIYMISLNKNETLMATANGGASVTLWDMIEFKEIRTISGHSGNVKFVAINEEKNQIISAAADNVIKVWNINDGSLIKTMTGHSGGITYGLLDKHTGLLYTVSRDGTAKEWNVDSGECLRTFTGHTGDLWSVLISEDGERIVTSSHDGTIIIRNRSSSEITKRLSYRTVLVDLKINPLNGQLLSTSHDQKMIFWPLKP